MASNPENVRLTVLMKLQEALDEEAILEEQMLALMHRFADRFTDRRVEINNLMVLHDHPLIDYGKLEEDICSCCLLSIQLDAFVASLEGLIIAFEDSSGKWFDYTVFFVRITYHINVSQSISLCEDDVIITTDWIMTGPVWLSLKKAYAPHSTSRKYTLKTQLLRIEMHGDETPDAYLNRAQEYADALAAIGEPVKDKDLVMLAVSVGSPSMPEARQAQLSELTAQLSALGFEVSPITPFGPQAFYGARSNNNNNNRSNNNNRGNRNNSRGNKN
ncbi:hypothetical protein Tco_1407586 [Tanacetum coccineum]